ncbi:hypothetical protein [Amycolatopsis sp. cmx-4-68]|uniref:hypothetical protein n=1 Tax=Amycolatopsis sp. cmx-4-68 TaxID=2790938 RepID=UPI00397D029E
MSTDPFTEGMVAALTPRPGPPEPGGGRRLLRALAVALIVAGLLAIALAVLPPTHAAQASWCNYPDPAAVHVLHQATAAEAANIHRYSPGAELDLFTIQLGLMAQCASVQT